MLIAIMTAFGAIRFGAGALAHCLFFGAVQGRWHWAGIVLALVGVVWRFSHGN